jgi:hypothetical protein
MSECLQLLDKALDLGQRELELLSAGMVEQTEETAHQRGAILERAWQAKEREAVDVDALMGKLRQLKSLQGQLTREARSLHKSLEEDLARSRKERGRLSGYRQATRIVPTASRFVSKRG